MSIVHELGGSFFHNTPDFLLTVHVRRCMMIQDIYISTYHLLWMGRHGRSRSQSGDVGGSSETERERSRIQMQLEEVRGRDS